MTKSREVRQKILKIMDLALKISPPDRERYLGETAVFVSYSPHCPVLSVDIHIHGWDKHNKNVADKAFWVLTDKKEGVERLDEVIGYLENLRNLKKTKAEK